MKFLLAVMLQIILNYVAVCQIDSDGNPIFKSVQIELDTLDNCVVSVYYYTMKGNVDNKTSSVYVSENPTLDQLILFPRENPSYFFVISRENVVSHLILVNSRIEGIKSKYSLLIVNPTTDKQIEVPASTQGDVTELRSVELTTNGYDKDARILTLGTRRFCAFDKVAYSIQPLRSVKEEVFSVIKNYRLHLNDVDLEQLNHK